MLNSQITFFQKVILEPDFIEPNPDEGCVTQFFSKSVMSALRRALFFIFHVIGGEALD